MDLKQQLLNYGCGVEFIDIALGYEQFYQPQQDIETFIDYVEEMHAKVEEAEELQKIDEEILGSAGVFEVLENEDLL